MIETENLRRAYGGRAALHGLSLTVAPGEILGFLGPNGAGKSTTVKILTGMITAGAIVLMIVLTAAIEYALRLRVAEAIGDLEFRN